MDQGISQQMVEKQWLPSKVKQDYVAAVSLFDDDKNEVHEVIAHEDCATHLASLMAVSPASTPVFMGNTLW